MALATQVIWERSLDAPSWVAATSLISIFATVVASSWALLIAPTRWLQAVAVVSLAVAAITAVLRWLANTDILETT